jgi:hypothetical protein
MIGNGWRRCLSSCCQQRIITWHGRVWSDSDRPTNRVFWGFARNRLQRTNIGSKNHHFHQQRQLGILILNIRSIHLTKSRVFLPTQTILFGQFLLFPVIKQKVNFREHLLVAVQIFLASCSWKEGGHQIQVNFLIFHTHTRLKVFYVIEAVVLMSYFAFVRNWSPSSLY